VRLDGYVRVSRVGGREGESFLSPDVQRERIKSFAKGGQHKVVTFHVDLDEPGSKYERPGFQAALGRVERGETDGIIVASLDRFARSVPDAAAALRRLEDAGGVLLSAKDALDTSTPVGKFARVMMLALAELELDRIREGWATSQAYAVARGVHIASRTPTGYVRNGDGRLRLDATTAPVVRELFRRRAAGAGWNQLADYMDEQGISGPYENSRWTPGTLAKMVRNRAYLGEARSGPNVNVDAHEAIVTRAEWEAAQGARGVSSARNGDGLLLAGLVRCAGCRYVVKPDTMRDRDGSRLGFYRCRRRHPAGRCPAPIGILARLLDPYIEQEFFAALGPDGALAEASVSSTGLESAVALVEEAERELAAYRDDAVVSVIGREAFLAGLEKRAAAVEAARRELAELRNRSLFTETISLTPSNLIEAWPELTIAERRQILTAAIDAVFIRSVRGSGRQRPVGERVMILWRGEAPDDLPRRGRRVPLASYAWPG
jgi:site-specific DNA recombinase